MKNDIKLQEAGETLRCADATSRVETTGTLEQTT